MIPESTCNTLAVTDLLVKGYPKIANLIFQNCKKRSVNLLTIKGAKDYWCRDFMPLQPRKNKFIQFIFNPSYYKHPKYNYLKTETNNLDFYPKQNVLISDIILDGGNICYHEKRVIITDKVFRDNKSIGKHTIIYRLCELLEVEELTIIPTLPYDITGHSDGMIRFIDDDTLLLNDLRLISSDRYWQSLVKSLKKFNLIILPNN